MAGNGEAIAKLDRPFAERERLVDELEGIVPDDIDETGLRAERRAGHGGSGRWRNARRECHSEDFLWHVAGRGAERECGPEGATWMETTEFAPTGASPVSGGVAFGASVPVAVLGDSFAVGASARFCTQGGRGRERGG